MTAAIALVLLGIVLLWAGAEGLVRGSASIASRLGLTPLVIGLTVVAFGTSTPELIVSVGSALEGLGGIAVGNAVGSNIINIGLIFGVLALIRPPRIHAHTIRFDVPIVIFASLLLVLFLLDDRLSRPEGVVLLAGLAAFTAFSLRVARLESAMVQAEYAQEIRVAARPAWADGMLVAGGLALLLGGGRALVMGAVTIAEALGMSDAVIGLTVVAFGTSLPELATSAVAALKGESDIAVGNIVGSNVFNIFGILGAASLVRPLTGSGMTAMDLGVMVGLALVLLPLMRTGFRISRWEGAALLAAYVVYTAYLIA